MIEVYDTSALILAARGDAAVAADLAEALSRDDVAITEPILLEYLNGARNLAEYDRFDVALRAARVLTTEARAWRRALEVHRLLAASGAGHQRSVRLVDLIIAAVAEDAGYPVAHFDEDYERIALLTGQPTRRVKPSYPAGDIEHVLADIEAGSLGGSLRDKVTRMPPDEDWPALRDSASETPDPDRSGRP